MATKKPVAVSVASVAKTAAAAVTKAATAPAPAPKPAPAATPAGTWVPAGGGQTYGAGPANVPSPTPSSTWGAGTPTGVIDKTPTTPTTPTTPAGPSAEDLYWANQTRLANEAATQAANERRAAQDSIIAYVNGVFSSYGMTDMLPLIEQYARQGLNGDAIAIQLRSTEQYAKRFPAMKALQAKGHAMSEAAYVAYEAKAAELEQQYALPKGMLMGSVTGLLTNEVSAAEMEDRVKLASMGSIMAPPEFKAQMKQRFGIDEGGLTAYYLDPAVAEPLLQKQYAMAIIGTEAAKQDINGVETDYLAQLAQAGVTQQQAANVFGEVATQTGLELGKGDVASENDLVQAGFGTSADARANVQRAISSRKGRFEAGGGFATDKQGNRGLGVSATS